MERKGRESVKTIVVCFKAFPGTGPNLGQVSLGTKKIWQTQKLKMVPDSTGNGKTNRGNDQSMHIAKIFSSVAHDVAVDIISALGNVSTQSSKLGLVLHSLSLDGKTELGDVTQLVELCARTLRKPGIILI